MPKLNQLVEVKIESLAVGGDGVGRFNGQVIFVPDSTPEDFLEVEITESHKNFHRAQIKRILTPSPHRREPPCAYATQCGGCRWQHITENEQLRQKEKMIISSLKKFLKTQEIPFKGMIPSPTAFRYRNRIQPHYQEGSLGFFKKRSHDLVPINDCLITEASLTALWPEIQKKLSTVRRKNGQIEIALDEELTPSWRFIEKADDSAGFSQVNRFLNTQLVEKVVQISKSLPVPGRLIDLYSGSGNFTFPLSNAHKKNQVIGVELNPALALRFREKTLQLNLSPKFIEIYNSDVENFVKKFPILPEDFVLLDPPRTGASSLVMKSLAQSGAHHIVYVSCHPTTLARDLELFMASAQACGNNYKIEQVLGFDLFPQTDHVETVVELRIDSFKANDNVN